MSRYINKRIFGNLQKPRVSVFRSNKFIYAQVIDDTAGHTLCSESSLKYNEVSLGKSASKLGSELSKKIKLLKIKNVLFDCGRYRYNGSIKILADSLRENGVQC